MRCSFCATGAGGFARGLSPAEIVDQVLTVQEAFGQRVSNVGALAPTMLSSCVAFGAACAMSASAFPCGSAGNFQNTLMPLSPATPLATHVVPE